MDRRKFLQFLGVGAGVAAVTAVAPGAVKFFLPPKGGWNDFRAYSLKDVCDLDDFERRILQPAIERVAAQFDEHAAQWMKVSLGGVPYYLPMYS